MHLICILMHLIFLMMSIEHLIMPNIVNNELEKQCSQQCIRTIIRFEMGAKNTKESYNKLLQSYQIIQENESQGIKYLQHKISQQEVLLKQITANDIKDCHRILDQLANMKIKLSGNKHVLQIKQFQMISDELYCGITYKIYVLYEHPHRTLDDQIRDRKVLGKHFTEAEIWSILASCVYGLAHLQKYSIPHSCLKSSRIMLSAQGDIKISDPSSSNTTTNYTSLQRRSNQKHIYASPQQTTGLQQELIMPQYNTYKSDVFTLGIIILQAGLLEYQDDCYRDNGFRIHWDTVSNNLDKFANLYAKDIADIVSFMLATQQRIRPDWLFLSSRYIQANVKQELSDKPQSLITSGDSYSINSNLRYAPIQPKPELQSNSNMQPPSTNSINFFPNRHSNSSQQLTAAFGQPFVRVSTPGQVVLEPYPIATPLVTPTQNQNRQILSHKSSLRSFHSQVQGIPQVPVLLPSNPHLLSPRSSQTSVSLVPQPQRTISSGMNTPSRETLISNIIRVSNIEGTRPLLNIFPIDRYTNKTKIDDNIIVVYKEDQKAKSSGKSFTNVEQRSNISSLQPRKYTQNAFSNEVNQNSLFKHFINKSTQRPPSYSTPNQYPLQSRVPIDKGFRPFNVLMNEETKQNGSIHKKQTKNQVVPQYVVQQYEQGSRYEGQKIGGLRNGRGKFFYQDGGYYDGMWKQNKMQGFGRLFYQSNKLAYEGEWRNDRFSGRGTIYNEQPQQIRQGLNYTNLSQIDEYWTKYEGQFINDEKYGQGRLYFSNGEVFEGYFKDDKIEGPGTYYTVQGQAIRGTWTNNRKIG